MQVWGKELGDFGTNCYIIQCEETGATAIVDPGTPAPWIKQHLTAHGLSISLILLTHGHLDHIGGVEWVKSFSGAPVLVHPDDLDMLSDPFLNGSALFGGDPIKLDGVDRLFGHGDLIELGNLRLKVLHTPGHSPGGVSFYTPGHLIAGDALFAGSIGRTDLPGGNYEVLKRSIHDHLFTLPDETVVYPGHGPTTTIGDERQYNPFL
jgi:hydroxyacylglutathione hydrolase